MEMHSPKLTENRSPGKAKIPANDSMIDAFKLQRLLNVDLI